MQFKYTTRPECDGDWHDWAQEYNITDYKICWEPLCPILAPGLMLPVVHFNDNRSLEELRILPDPAECHRLIDNLQLNNLEEHDVACVLCDEVVCGFYEEPPHKDDRDEAVCDECWVQHYE